MPKCQGNHPKRNNHKAQRVQYSSLPGQKWTQNIARLAHSCQAVISFCWPVFQHSICSFDTLRYVSLWSMPFFTIGLCWIISILSGLSRYLRTFFFFLGTSTTNVGSELSQCSSEAFKQLLVQLCLRLQQEKATCYGYVNYPVRDLVMNVGVQSASDNFCKPLSNLSSRLPKGLQNNGG